MTMSKDLFMSIRSLDACSLDDAMGEGSDPTAKDTSTISYRGTDRGCQPNVITRRQNPPPRPSPGALCKRNAA
jgi:hypothetical protein